VRKDKGPLQREAREGGGEEAVFCLEDLSERKGGKSLAEGRKVVKVKRNGERKIELRFRFTITEKKRL